MGNILSDEYRNDLKDNWTVLFNSAYPDSGEKIKYTPDGEESDKSFILTMADERRNFLNSISGLQDQESSEKQRIVEAIYKVALESKVQEEKFLSFLQTAKGENYSNEITNLYIQLDSNFQALETNQNPQIAFDHNIFEAINNLFWNDTKKSGRKEFVKALAVLRGQDFFQSNTRGKGTSALSYKNPDLSLNQTLGGLIDYCITKSKLKTGEKISTAAEGKTVENQNLIHISQLDAFITELIRIVKNIIEDSKGPIMNEIAGLEAYRTENPKAGVLRGATSKEGVWKSTKKSTGLYYTVDFPALTNSTLDIEVKVDKDRLHRRIEEIMYKRSVIEDDYIDISKMTSKKEKIIDDLTPAFRDCTFIRDKANTTTKGQVQQILEQELSQIIKTGIKDSFNEIFRDNMATIFDAIKQYNIVKGEDEKAIRKNTFDSAKEIVNQNKRNRIEAQKQGKQVWTDALNLLKLLIDQWFLLISWGISKIKTEYIEENKIDIESAQQYFDSIQTQLKTEIYNDVEESALEGEVVRAVYQGMTLSETESSPAAALLNGTISEIFITCLLRFTLGSNASVYQKGTALEGEGAKQAVSDVQVIYGSNNQNKQNQIGIQAKHYAGNNITFYGSESYSITQLSRYMPTNDMNSLIFLIGNQNLLHSFDNTIPDDLSDLYPFLSERLSGFIRFQHGEADYDKQAFNNILQNNFYIINFNVIPASVILLYTAYLAVQDLAQKEGKKIFGFVQKPKGESAVKIDGQNRMISENAYGPNEIYNNFVECKNLVTALASIRVTFKGISINIDNEKLSVFIKKDIK